MFGLMKARVCSQPGPLRQHRRLHYCGTCKTIGRLYGQKSRMLLNHDAVFLGEVLSALSGEDRDLERWDHSYQSYNCFSLPAGVEEAPAALRFAATAAMISAEFKVADGLADSNRYTWKIAGRLFSSGFQEASAQLEKWRFPLDLLWQCSRDQAALELAAPEDRRTKSPTQILKRLAEPTSRATAMIFAHGALVVGCVESREILRSVGDSFGSIVYLLDAIEDYEKDFRAGGFNAIRAAFDLSAGELPPNIRAEVTREIWLAAERVADALGELPIPSALAARFSTRLRSNLAGRLSRELPVLAHVCEHRSEVKVAARERWRDGVRLARSITKDRMASAAFKAGGTLQAPFIFLSALAVTLVFPRQTRSAKNYRECMDVAFNLMFLGSVLKPSFIGSSHLSSSPGGGGTGGSSGPGSIFPPGYTPPASSPGGPGHPSGQQSGSGGETGGKKRGGGCGVCCCDCGDCDCCCDCGECCGSCDC